MKNHKKVQKSTLKYKAAYFFWIHPTDLWCNMLQTLEKRRIIEVVWFCQTNTLLGRDVPETRRQYVLKWKLD